MELSQDSNQSPSSIDSLTLPRGFEERCTKFTGFELKTLNSFYTNALLMNAPVVRLPYVGYAETFTRGSHITGEKFFPLVDRKGRELMLTPDGMALLMRWYLASARNLPTDVAWISPVFRYRKQGNRQFTQFGYAGFNHPPARTPSAASNKLIELASTTLKTVVRDLGVRCRAVFTHPGAWKSILRTSAGLNDSEINDVMRTFRSVAPVERSAWLEKRLPQPALTQLHELLALNLSGKGKQVTGATDRIRTEAQDLIRFAAQITGPYDMEWVLDLGDLHSCELLSGPAVRFFSESGRPLGDGGTYDCYGQLFHPSIKTYTSVGFGVEGLSTAAGISNLDLTEPGNAALLVFPDCVDRIFPILEKARSEGVAVSLVEIDRPLRKLLGRYENFAFTAVIGEQELASQSVTLRNMRESSSQVVQLNDLVGVLKARTTSGPGELRRCR